MTRPYGKLTIAAFVAAALEPIRITHQELE
jgi:hypothetical protein